MTPSPPEARTGSLLGLLFVGVLMGALDIAIVGPALPAIRAEFGVDDRALSTLFTVYVLFNLVGAPLMAKLSDRHGRRVIYLLDVALFALGSLLVATAPAFPLVVAGRAIQGFGAGGIFPVASALIGDRFPPERQGRALGLLGAVFGLAFLVGPVLAGILLHAATWHWLFLVNLPVAALVLLWGARLLPAGAPAARQPFDAPGLVALAAILAGLAGGISSLDTAHVAESLAHPRTWAFLSLALVSVPVFWQLERRAADPVVRPTLLARRQILLACALAFGAGLGETVIVYLPTLATASLGVTASRASFLLLPIVLAMTVGSPSVGRALEHTGTRALVVTGLAILVAGLAWFATGAGTVSGFIWAGALLGLGLSGLLGAPLRFILLNEAPPGERAAAQGFLTLFIGLGQLLGGALVGAVAASAGGGAHGYRAALLATAVAEAGLLLLAFGLRGRTEERAHLAARTAA